MSEIAKKNHTVVLIFCAALLACLFAGCGDESAYKEQADIKVDEVLQQKWDEKFGIMTNYRISDIEPDETAVAADQTVEQGAPLDLASAVAKATASNRAYQLERETLYLQALNLTLVRHGYELNPFLNSALRIENARTETTTDNLEIDLGNNTVARLDTNLGFNQMLSTGAMVSANIGLGWIDIISGDANSGLRRIFAASINQPLMRGSGKRIALESLTQAERDTLYQIRYFNRFRKIFVVSIASQYYRVLQNLDAVINADDNYQALEKLYAQIETLTKAGKVPKYELEQAKQDKLEAIDILVQANRDYKQLLDEFKLELAISPASDLLLDTNELDELFAVGITEFDFDENQAIEQARVHRLDLANFSDRVVDADRKIEVAKDSIRTGLNLVGTGDMTKTDNGTSENYTVGLDLDLPLDRTLEKVNLRTAQINLLSSKRNLSEASDMIDFQVKQAYRNLKDAAMRYAVDLERCELARNRLEDTSSLLKYARASTRDVLDSQEDMFKARNDVTATLTDYMVAMMEFHRDTGILQVRPDGMWQQ